jgi:hypothetical protein
MSKCLECGGAVADADCDTDEQRCPDCYAVWYIVTQPACEVVPYKIREATMEQLRRALLQLQGKPNSRSKVAAIEARLRKFKKERKCRVCGCTWDKACMTALGPCSWVEWDLCSACVHSELMADGWRPCTPQDLAKLKEEFKKNPPQDPEAQARIRIFLGE